MIIIEVPKKHHKNKDEEYEQYHKKKNTEEEKYSSGMQKYIDKNGRTFNKKLCDFAVSKMITENSEGEEAKLIPWGKSDVDSMLRKYGIYIENNNGYDVCYCANMFKSDFLGKSLPNDQYLCIHLKCYLDDVDGNPHRAFDEYVANAADKKVSIPWDSLI